MSIFEPIPRYRGPLPDGVEHLCWPDEVDRDDWLELRQLGVGGSDVASLYKAAAWEPGEPAPYSTPLQLFRSKVDPIRRGLRDFTIPQLVGLHMERLIAHLYAEQKKARVVQLPMVRRDGWMVSSPDLGVVANDDPYKLIGGVEMKRPMYSSLPNWRNGEAPENYVIQSMWYAAVWGQPWWDLFALIGEQHPILHPVTLDVELVDLLKELASSWWLDNVKAGVEPASMNEDEERSRLAEAHHLAEKHAAWAESSADDDEAYGRMLEYKKLSKQYEAKAKGLANRFAKKAVGFAGLKGPGWKGSWGDRRGRPDWKRLAAEHGIDEKTINQYRPSGSHSFKITKE